MKETADKFSDPFAREMEKSFRAAAKGRGGLRETLKKTGCRIEPGMTAEELDAGSSPA